MSGHTLEGLEGVWAEEPELESHLVKTCHRLRKKSIGQFSIEDFRIMIGQSVGLLHLLPRAVAILEVNPLAEGDFYSGDLLSAVLNADRAPLRQDPELRRRMMAVACQAETLIGGEAHADARSVEARLLRDVKQFISDQNLSA